MNQKTFVLVHGAWHGGWCWRRVSDLLERQGPKVFSPTLTGEAELILSTFAPGARSGDEQVSRMAEQSGFVIVGELALNVGVRVFRLRTGDSFRIGRGEAFSAANPGAETSVSLWVIAPPRY